MLTGLARSREEEPVQLQETGVAPPRHAPPHAPPRPAVRSEELLDHDRPTALIARVC